MAHALPPTLAEVRQAVAVRLGFGPQAARSPAMKDVLDELIRRAARELILEAHWVELRIREDIATVDGGSEYDFPDNMEPGRLERIVVVGEDGSENELEAGIRPYEREQFTRGSDPKDLPLRYELVNGSVTILPAPDATRYPTLRIEGYSRPPDPQQNADRIPVDKEALIQWATSLGKAQFNKPDAGVAMAAVREYVKRLRPMQSDGESVQIGGHFSQKFRYAQGRRTLCRSVANYWLR
jgi:hypothetical protein